MTISQQKTKPFFQRKNNACEKNGNVIRKKHKKSNGAQPLDFFGKLCRKKKRTSEKNVQKKCTAGTF